MYHLKICWQFIATVNTENLDTNQGQFWTLWLALVLTRSVTTMFFLVTCVTQQIRSYFILCSRHDSSGQGVKCDVKINYTRFRRTNRTLTSRSESRNLSWRFVSMCNWFPASLSACSLLLGMVVWSLGANSMSISTSCQEPKESWFKRVLHDIIHLLSVTNESRQSLRRAKKKMWEQVDWLYCFVQPIAPNTPV